MTTHTLKTWPPFFGEVASGRKTFEIRAEQDRRFDVGDVLRLEEFTPGQGHSGRVVYRRVVYVLRDERFVLPGHVVMGLVAAKESEVRNSCNRHADCAAAEARTPGTDHCHDEDCEDCFGR